MTFGPHTISEETYLAYYTRAAKLTYLRIHQM